MPTKKEMRKKKDIAKKMIEQMNQGGYEAWLHEQHTAYIEGNLETFLDMNEPTSSEKDHSTAETRTMTNITVQKE